MSSSAVQKNTTVVQAPPKRSWADVARAAAAPAPSAAERPAAAPAASEADASACWGSTVQHVGTALAAAGEPRDEAVEARWADLLHSWHRSSCDLLQADAQSVAEAQPEDEPLDEEAADEAEPELESFDSEPQACGMRASAPSFVPGLSAAATEFVPAAVPAFEKHYALAFVPVAHAKKVAPQLATGLNGFAFNVALLSDDSDSEEEGSTDAGGSSDRSLGASSDSEHEAGKLVGRGRRGARAGAGVSLSWDAPPGLPVPKGVVLTGFRPAPGLSLF